MATPDPQQPLTREILDWIARQGAIGHSAQVMSAAMLATGWHPDVVERAMRTVAEGGGLRPVPSVSAPQTVPSVPVPSLQPAVSNGMVDAGDKWVELLHQGSQPDIVVFRNLLSGEECDALIEAARPRLVRSMTVDQATGGEELNADRTSQGMFFARGETAVLSRIEARIERLFGWPQKNGEGMQVLRYGPGAEYKPHYDYFDPLQPGTPSILQRGGQRVATLIMYLHEPAEGGGTVFPAVQLRVAPRRGNAVFFSYARAHPDSLTLHGGEPVGAGEKWIATKWLREREFV